MRIKIFIKSASVLAAIFLWSSASEAKVTVTTYFASWCASCNIEVDFFKKLLADRPNDFVIKGVCVDRNEADGKAKLKKIGALESWNWTFDTNSTIQKLPHIVISKDGGETKTYNSFNDTIKKEIISLAK